MATISLCMIVRDEARVLARCLDSAAGVADEIILVDTGSTDNTKEIARRYTDKIYDFIWEDDFSAARNESFSKATMDYWMWLDADDVLEAPDREALIALKQELGPEVETVMLPYHTAFDADGRPSFTCLRERLIRRREGMPWEGAVHEAITPRGKVLLRDIAVTHRKEKSGVSDRNLCIYENLRAKGHPFSAREQYYYARELFYHGRRADAAEMLRGFLRRDDAWTENLIEACQLLACCLYQDGEEEEALHALLRGLAFDEPRAELCCDIGRHFFDRGRYAQALFWYRTAAERGNGNRLGFARPDCHAYIPYIQMCVCHYRLGNLKEAAACNERAHAAKPGDRACLHNRAFFSQAARRAFF